MCHRLVAIIWALLFCTVTVCASAEEAIVATEAIQASGRAITGYKKIYTETDNHGGLWVFCAEEISPTFSGEFWFVIADQAYSLAQSDDVSDWGLLTCEPNLFYISEEAASTRHVSLFSEDKSQPVQISLPGRLASVQTLGNSVIAMVEPLNYDYCVLKLSGNALTEVLPVSVSLEELLSETPGVAAMVDELKATWTNVEVLSCLEYETGLVAINYTSSGNPWHIYFYEDENGWNAERGWEDDFDAFEGYCTVGPKIH